MQFMPMKLIGWDFKKKKPKEMEKLREQKWYGLIECFEN